MKCISIIDMMTGNFSEILNFWSFFNVIETQNYPWTKFNRWTFQFNNFFLLSKKSEFWSNKILWTNYKWKRTHTKFSLLLFNRKKYCTEIIFKFHWKIFDSSSSPKIHWFYFELFSKWNFLFNSTQSLRVISHLLAQK
jgi:hypothetical protein